MKKGDIYETDTGNQSLKNMDKILNVMSATNQPFINTQNEIFRRNLAGKLGITFDELTKLTYKMTTHSSNDGRFLNYTMEFDTDSPEEIMNKIDGINSNHQLRLEPWELDDDD